MTKIKLSAYEVGCHTFSQVIITSSLADAVKEFERLHPDETIIWAQNNDVINVSRNQFYKKFRP